MFEKGAFYLTLSQIKGIRCSSSRKWVARCSSSRKWVARSSTGEESGEFEVAVQESG